MKAKKTAYIVKRKGMAGVAAVGLAAALTVPFVAFAADVPVLGWGNAASGCQGRGALCVDADGDDVCDRFADANGDGVCDNRAVHAACNVFSRGFASFGEFGCTYGANFVDEDGDGICDRRGTGANGLGLGNANGYGARNQGSYASQGASCGACGDFVDEDGNGVCDNAGSGSSGCGAYVDSDGNGVCDNYASRSGSGQGAGRGHGLGGGHHGNCA